MLNLPESKEISEEELHTNSIDCDYFIQCILHEHGLENYNPWDVNTLGNTDPQWRGPEFKNILKLKRIEHWKTYIPFDPGKIFRIVRPDGPASALYYDWSFTKFFGDPNLIKEWQQGASRDNGLDIKGPLPPESSTWLITSEFYLRPFFEEFLFGNQYDDDRGGLTEAEKEKAAQLLRDVDWKRFLWSLLIHWYQEKMQAHTGQQDDNQTQISEPDKRLATTMVRYNAARLEGCSWADVTIAFKSNDSVLIKIKGHDLKRFTFAEIGFKDGRRGDMPDTKWDLLMGAAQGGKNEMPDGPKNLKQAVSTIRKRLRAVIQLKGDPIPWDYVKKRYVPAFRLEDQRYGGSG